MNNSVIISSICPRIEYYATAAGITNDVEKKEYKKKVLNLEKNIAHPQLLDLRRNLETFNLAMGDKRTTEKMYLEKDLQDIKKIEEMLFPIDKNRGRNFVNNMKQNNVANLEENSNGYSNGKQLTKNNGNKLAYSLYSNAK